MSFSNCLFFAAWRTIRRGGVLILQRSHSGPYLHAMWAERLPSELAVEHFSPDNKSKGIKMEPLFSGSVARCVGESHSEPPREKLGISLIFASFWIINALGWVAVIKFVIDLPKICN